MPITDKQKELRKKHIGASESAAILGLSPYKTPYDVWLLKTGKVESPASVGEAGDIGNMIEDGLLDYGASELGVRILKNQFRVHTNGILSATHDALVVDVMEGMEAKTSGIMSFATKDEWGDNGTDQVPSHIIIQCQHQALVSNLDLVHVPALIGGRGRLMFRIERSESICEIILEKVTAFWEDNVQKDIPPEGTPSLNIIRLRKREPGLTLPISADIVLKWRDLEAKRKEAVKAEDEAKAACLSAMGDAEIGESDAGNVVVQKVEVNRLDTKALKAKHPDIAEKFTKKSETTRVTFKKARLLKA